MNRSLFLGASVAIALGLGIFYLTTQKTVAIRVEGAQTEIFTDGPGGAVVTLSIRNDGTEPDRLTAAASDITEAHMFHVHHRMGDQVHMMPLESVDIPPGTTVLGDTSHIVLLPLLREVEVGELINLTLTFEQAGDITVRARIAAISAQHNPGGMDHDAPYHVPADEPQPALSAMLVEGSTGDWVLTLEVSNFAFDESAADGPHEPGIGHGHLYVDGVKIGRIYATEHPMEMAPGMHTIRITLNTNDHRAYHVDGDPVAVELDVEIPSTR